MTKTNFIRSRTTETQIGNTKYIVTSTFNENARESVEQKLLRHVAERLAAEIRNPETA